MASLRDFLLYETNTSLDRPTENPFLLFILRSNNVSRRYFDEPGEHVKSLVKSDFFPYPIPFPFRVREDLEL